MKVVRLSAVRTARLKYTLSPAGTCNVRSTHSADDRTSEGKRTLHRTEPNGNESTFSLLAHTRTSASEWNRTLSQISVQLSASCLSVKSRTLHKKEAKRKRSFYQNPDWFVERHFVLTCTGRQKHYISCDTFTRMQEETNKMYTSLLLI